VLAASGTSNFIMMKRPNQRSIIQSYQISTISTCYGAVRTGTAATRLGPILNFETLGCASWSRGRAFGTSAVRPAGSRLPDVSKAAPRVGLKKGAMGAARRFEFLRLGRVLPVIQRDRNPTAYSFASRRLFARTLRR
jgi:hypothetical protein